MATKFYEMEVYRNVITAEIASNNIINRGKKDSINISPMKLQKLLYFTYALYLHKTGEPLFADRFETWKYGPVVSSVFQEFKEFKDRPITRYATSGSQPPRMIDEDVSVDFKECLDVVWDVFKRYTGTDLSKITHIDNLAWKKTIDNNECIMKEENVKPDGKWVEELYEEIRGNRESTS